MIPLARPLLGDEELALVTEVVRSGRLVQGERVAEFENVVARACGRRHGIAVTNGTTALELALRAVGVQANNEVLCPDFTWPSPANAILATGAMPVLVDVDLHEWNVRGEALAQARTSRTRAAIVIDQFGAPVRKKEIEEALQGIPIIEDSACALGSRFADAPCGSFGAISCISFHPRKIITTGEGGMCLTNDDDLATRLRILRNHGQQAPGSFVIASGNYRLSEIAAAIGIEQMKRLDAFIESRQRLAARYRDALPQLEFQEIPDGCGSNYQTIGALLRRGTSANERDTFIAKMRERGVELSRLSYAVHELPTFQHAQYRGTTCSRLANRGIAVPAYPSMAEAEREATISMLEQVLNLS